MHLIFEPIRLDKQAEYKSRLARCDLIASDYSFLNLWPWSEEYGLSWAWTDTLVWIKQAKPEERFWAPVGPWDEVNWNRCLSRLGEDNVVFDRIPETLLRLWEKELSDRISFEESRGHWDYLYDVSELIELKGKRFHKKKNLVNQFKKNYTFQYNVFDATLIDKAMAMQEAWCTWRDCESSETLSYENRAISKVLTNWENLKGLLGGVIVVDQEIAAYTIAEALSDEILVIHFEKGNSEYKGVYQAINQMFLEYSGKDYKIVNREQDLDDEGLRKAKLSYNPVNFVKKYRVMIK